MLNDWKNPKIDVSTRIIAALGVVGAASKEMLFTLLNSSEIDSELEKVIEYGIVLKTNNNNNEVFLLSPIGQELYEKTVHLKALNVTDIGGVEHALDVLDVALRTLEKIPAVDWYTTQEANVMLKILCDIAKIPRSADIPRPDALIHGAQWAVWLQVLHPFVGVSTVAQMASQYAAIFDKISGFHAIVWVAQDAEQARRVRTAFGITYVPSPMRISLFNVSVLGYEVGQITALTQAPIQLIDSLF